MLKFANKLLTTMYYTLLATRQQFCKIQHNKNEQCQIYNTENNTLKPSSHCPGPGPGISRWKLAGIPGWSGSTGTFVSQIKLHFYTPVAVPECSRLRSRMCVNWFIDAKCGLLCVVCLSPPAFRLHRWIGQQWVKIKQSASVFLASI